MAETVNVGGIFDQSFRFVADKIVHVELQMEDGMYIMNKDQDLHVSTITTKGPFDAMIICEFSSNFYEHITQAMFGGTPPEADRELYVNEFMNIACGRAVSHINDQIGQTTRISVPTSQEGQVQGAHKARQEEKVLLSYTSKYGIFRVIVYYTMNGTEKRRVSNG